MLVLTRRNGGQIKFQYGPHQMTCAVFTAVSGIWLGFSVEGATWQMHLDRWETFTFHLAGHSVTIQYLSGTGSVHLSIDAPPDVQITRDDAVDQLSPQAHLTDADRLQLLQTENRALRAQLAGCHCPTAHTNIAPGEAA